MYNLTMHQKLHFTLRFAAAMCFIGHGAFGIITKPIWCNYFAVFGIAKTTAYQLMPWVGCFDILCGVILLIYPIRIIPLWLVIWGIFTAALRPLSGEPFAEFIERAGNFGAPLALLLLSGGFPSNTKKLFGLLNPNVTANALSVKRATKTLQIIVFLLLTGHGWLNLIEKKAIISQYAAIAFTNPPVTAQIIGIAEITAAILILVKPLRPVILLFFVWKMTSELFYPHWEAFEWIERGGSYGCILALWFIVPGLVRGSCSQVPERILRHIQS